MRNTHGCRRSSLVCVAASALLCAGAAEAEPDMKPNIVLILADDLGWGNVGYHGGVERTPHMDRLAREGVEFDAFYVAPLCSPTRAGIMTGRHPLRFGVGCSVITPWNRHAVPADERMMAEVLADAGYKRRGCFGKWHLGHSHVSHHPLSRGFTHFYGCYNGAIDYFTHMREGELDWHNGHAPAREEGYATDLITDAAVTFIEESSADEPFFAYVPYTAPHSPLQAPEKYLDMYPELKNEDKKLDRPRQVAAMVTCLDDGIGRIVKALDDKGVADHTLLIFLSDNGAGIGGVSGELKGRKAQVFEGGVKAVGSARWPAGGLTGGRKVAVPMSYVDLLPTFMALAGVGDHKGKPLDGIDIMPYLKGKTTAPDRPIYHYVGYGARDQLAVMEGEWKLIYMGPRILETGKPLEEGELYLFRIHEDPNEQNNLAGEHPDVVKRLLARLKKYRSWHGDYCIVKDPATREGFEAPKDWTLPGTEL